MFISFVNKDKAKKYFSTILFTTLFQLPLTTVQATETTVACEVIISGGTTAALAAALTSANEGAETCLVEPTDWIGGQLTAEGVSAIDFPHHKTDTGVNMGTWGLQLVNNSKLFMEILNSFQGNPGNCWVSKKCFLPKEAHNIINGYVNKQKNLKVFLNSVVKKAFSKAKHIESIQIIQRKAKTGTGYERFLSQDLSDWYSKEESQHFSKKVIRLVSKSKDKRAIFIDASPFGDLLVLSAAKFLQGAESEDGSTNSFTSLDTCGQATVFPFAMELSQSEPTTDVTHRAVFPEFYSIEGFTWEKVWSYRRAKAAPECQSSYDKVCTGDISLQNWNPGNDFPFGYLFKSYEKTIRSTGDWQGGINTDVLSLAEGHAIGWYQWLKSKAPASFKNRLSLAKSVMGTSHGLSKLPYLRDTRRSVGIDFFLLNLKHLKGNQESIPTGERFDDTIAIGSYISDFHPLSADQCRLPDYVFKETPYTRPFFIPFRALTNKTKDNLLVAGRTMAQSFWANSATRLQPIEWSTGTAAGAAAAFMYRWNASSLTALGSIKDIQSIVKKYQPISWTIKGVRYGNRE